MIIPAQIATFGTTYTIWCAPGSSIWLVINFGASLDSAIQTVLAEAFADLTESWQRNGAVMLGHGDKGPMVYQVKVRWGITRT